jgi:hypothetical protein
MHSFEGKMSFKLILRRLVMAFVLGGHSVLGVGMNREKIESLMHAMNQSNVELSISDAEGEGDSTQTSTDASEDCREPR